MIAPRTKTMDYLVYGGWTALIILGQWLLPFESRVVQWMATLWMWGGILVVRRSACLPFLLMTLPVFMCEIHRSWAWAQVAMAWFFLIRLLVEDRPSRREWGVLLAAGLIVGFYSWPLDYVDRFENLSRFTSSQLLQQWFQPQAVWAIFAFRQTADRLLLTGLCVLLIGRREYFSTHRLAAAFLYAAVMAILANYATAILPWHEPHRFLGTSNYGAFKGRLLHGAGYNQHYMSFVMALGLPWLFIPLGRKRFAFTMGLIGLMIPLILIEQLAFRLTVLVLMGLGLLLMAPAMWNRTRRRKLRQHYRLPAGYRRYAVLTFVLALGITALWGWRLGADGQASLLRVHVKDLLVRSSPEARYRMAERLLESDQLSEAQKRQLERRMRRYVSGKDEDEPEEHDESVPLTERLEKVDAARTHMWKLAWDRLHEHSLWRGDGAGTWASFHRAAPRRARMYFAHAHNTYVDLAFEYGIIPVAILLLAAMAGLLRLCVGRFHAGRLWLFYFVALAVLAMGQHLLYAFSTAVALIPGLVLLGRAFRRKSSKP